MNQDFQLHVNGADTKDFEFSAIENRLKPYVKALREVVDKRDWTVPESSLLLPGSREAFQACQDVLKKLHPEELKLIIIVGIGGSNLGTKAIYEGAYGTLDQTNNRQPKMLFADTVSPTVLQGILDACVNLTSKKEVVVNVISKSGSTTETIANFEYVYRALTELFGDVNDRIVITTDAGSALEKEAKEQAWKTLIIPATVGGRFSIFSSVGLFPLMATNIMGMALLDGALAMRDLCLEPTWEKNPAMQSAAITYTALKTGKPINNLFVFNPELESMGKWYRQLLAESLGKAKNLDGKAVHEGMMPVVSVGSTDLHAMAQLYLGGPKNVLTTFVYHPQTEFDTFVPNNPKIGGLVSGIAGKRHADIMTAIYEATKAAYLTNGLRFMDISLGFLHEATLSEFMQFKMIEVMFLGNLLNVDTFNQPNVEDYKKHMRILLGAE